jgi:hypothetical protein
MENAQDTDVAAECPAGVTCARAGEEISVEVAPAPLGDDQWRRVRARATAGALWIGGGVALLSSAVAAMTLDRRLLGGWLLIGLIGGVAVAFCLAWLTGYLRQVREITLEQQRRAIVRVRPQRLVIEQTAPEGAERHELVRTQIRDIKLVRRPSGDGRLRHGLGIFCQDGRMIAALDCADEAQARWVAVQVRRTMGFEPAEAV